MKHFYELPTDDVIIDCLANDTIGRNQDVVSFCEILDSFDYSTIVSLDGVWGSGKTFFVKQTKMLIDGKCNTGILEQQTKIKLEKALEAAPKVYGDLKFLKTHSTVYYDAWSNDDDTDPILSILYSVINSEQVKFSIRKDRDLLEIITSVADCVTGRSISDFFKAIKGSDFFVELEKRESIDAIMRKFFDAAIGDEYNRLIIFIDELDRCKPSFAVSLLERIKHFFNDNRITFIFSVNRDQLQHTVCNFYGNGINGSKYLDKFFDLNILLPEANKRNFLTKMGFEKTKFIYDMVCFAAIDYCHLELREIAKFFQHIKITTFKSAHTESNHRYNDLLTSFCLIYIVPILVALQIADQNRFDRVIRGEENAPFIDILSISDIYASTYHWLLDNNETFSTIDPSGGRVKVKYPERLDQVYSQIAIAS